MGDVPILGTPAGPCRVEVKIITFANKNTSKFNGHKCNITTLKTVIRVTQIIATTYDKEMAGLDRESSHKIRQLRITSGANMAPGSTPWLVSLGRMIKEKNRNVKDT